MGESAVPAPCREVVAADSQVVGTGGPAIPAGCVGHDVPDIITPDPGKTSLLCNLLPPRDKDPGGTTVFTDHLGLVRDRLYNLVCLLVAMVAGRPVPGENEPVRHA